jgi:outer membrane lipoprotein-sorting protein
MIAQMRWNTQFALFALVLKLACAQTQPDVSEILKKVSETYKAASNYEFVIDQSLSEPGAGGNISCHAHIAFKSPNQYRLEGTMPGMTPIDDALIVDDGSTLWFYLAKSNEYGSVPASALTSDAPGDSGDMRPEAFDEFVMSRYREADSLADGAKLLREEQTQLGNEKIGCYVVSVSGGKEEDASTWWVDKTHYRILREESAESKVVFTMIKLNQPLPDDLFKFTPPPGARKVDFHP